MRRSGSLAAVAAVGLLAAACGSATDFSVGSTNPTSPTLPTAATAADLTACVQDINVYRARVGRPPYVESSSLEGFAAASAQQDAATGTPHAHFGSDGGGVALAENEFLRQGLTNYGTVQAAIQAADALFFGEGPGGEHYQNLTNPVFTQAGCGVFIQNGVITIAQDFR
jgi:uncharacterized protein YkwD